MSTRLLRRRPDEGSLRAPTGGRTTPRAARGDGGDTLIEILIAMVILGIATLSLLTAFATTISASAEHRSLATFDTVIRSAAQQVISQIQQQPNPLYESCAPASYYQSGPGAVSFSVPSGYTVGVTGVQYWNGTSFTTNQSSCVANSPQWVTITVTQGSSGQSYTNNVIIDDPYAPPIPQNLNAYQLVFVQQPSGAVVNDNFTTQPVVAVEDDTGHVVTTDLSPVTLTITPNTGTSGATLSSSCTGVESSGVVTFSSCSINTTGIGYQLTATDPGLVSAISTAFNVSTQIATPLITSAIPSTTEAGAINVTFTPPTNAPTGETYTATACSTSGLGFGCVTQNNFTSGTDITGLSPGSGYYVTITANAPNPLYLSSTSSTAGPVQATVQLNAPGAPSLAYGTVAGSIQVSFATPTPAAPTQTYTATACTNAQMTSGCVSGSVAPGGNLTGLAYTAGSPGTSYYVEVTAAASSGYLASSPSSAVGPEQDESAVDPPTALSTSPSSSAAGAITVTFTASGGSQAPSSYTLTLCTNAAMTAGCTSRSISAGTTTVSGLTQGTAYYSQITANPPTGAYAQANSSVAGPTMATVQLSAPTGIATAYGTVAGSIQVTFTAPANAAPAQTYTVTACTTSAMNSGCVTNASYNAGANLTGLAYSAGSPGTSYWVTVAANASSGYFASGASSVVGPQAATSQLNAPGRPTAATSTTTGGAITVTFSAPSGTAPTGYTATACTNSSMTQGCVSGASITSGGTLSGLNGGSYYYVTITAIGPAGYVNATSSVSSSSTVASVQLATPSITAVTPSATTAGQLSISFTGSSNAPFGQTYTATACTNPGMSTSCVTQSLYSTGAAMLGLTAGTYYYVTITANASAGYIAATTSDVGPTIATVQLSTPAAPSLAYGSVAGSIAVTVNSSNAPAGQLYTVKACTNSSMTSGCVTTTNVASGGNATNLSYTVGSPGTNYYVTAYAQASSGYLASGTSGVAGPQAATSQLYAPGTPSVASSTTTAGAVVATFTNSSGPTVAGYTANACTNAAMTQNCVTQTGYTSGTQLSGLNQGSNYYVTITANSSSAAYAAATSSVSSSSAMATVQLAATTITAVAPSTTTAGAVTVSFTGPGNGPFGQGYTATACTSPTMSSGCVTVSNYTSGSQLTGLTAGSTYYVTITANASTGYLSSVSTVNGPTMATVQLATPGTPTLAYGTVAGSIAVTVSSSNAPSGQLYTVKACTNSSMTSGCITTTNVTTGGNATGLTYTPGSAGSNYYVTAYAQASSGYLASGTSGVAGPHADTSALNAPTGLTTSPSTTTAGALTATFTSSTGQAPASYTATVCTNSAMTTGCVTVTGDTSGAALTGLSQGTGYYVTITAVPSSAAFVAATTATSGPTLATTQLTAPTGVTLSYGAVAGSITIAFTAPANASGSQTYTAEACTNAAMTAGCVTSPSFTSGSNLTGLAYTQGVAGTSYYATVTANASSGYLASGASSVAGPQADTSQLNAPGQPTVASSTVLAGAVTATFTTPTGQVPDSYTAKACTNSAMTTGCLTQTYYASNGQIQPLTEGQSYYVTITSVSASSAFLPATSAVSSSAAMASIQLAAPTVTAAAPSTSAGGASQITFTGSPNAPGAQSYTATACTDAAMTQNCVSQSGYSSGANLSGLTPATPYYVEVTAAASTGYIAQVSNVFGPVGAASQLGTPTNVTLAYGTVAGSIAITFTGSSNAVAGQTYTARVCTTSAMGGTCFTNANFASGSNFTGLSYTQGSAGVSYWVTITANASSGYVASPASSIAGPQADTSQVNAPTALTVASSTTTAGAITASFTAPTGTAPASYTAVACTNSAMTNGCTTATSFTSGGTISGLVAGTTYYVQVTAVGPAGYVAATGAVSSGVPATTQLAAPTGVTLGYGTVAGSIAVSFTGSSNAPGSQTYTVEVCTTSGMGGTCFTNANFASGSNFTGLSYSPGSAGTSYYATVTANASAGYLVSPASSVAGPQAATSQENPPGTPTVTSSASTTGAVVATFNPPSGQAPASYNATACTNAQMNAGCHTVTGYTSGAQLSGLQAGSSYWVTITAVGPAGFLSATSAASASSALAAVQLTAPTGISLGYGSTAGSLTVTYSGSSNAPTGQTYTVTACTSSQMNTGCTTNASLASGGTLTGLAYTPGSAGTPYYVTVTANASTGYLASAASSVAGPHADTSALNAPGTPTVASSTTTAGAITASFTAPSGTTPASYSATACTSAAMNTGCSTASGFSSGGQISSLTAGQSYWVTITANPPTGYVAATSVVSATSAMASVQLAAPTLSSVAPSSTTAGQLVANFTGSSNAPTGQSYTLTACTNAQMNAGCSTQSNYTTGTAVTSLTAGTNYYVTVTAQASSGYLAAVSSVVGPTMATVQLSAPTLSAVAPSTTTAGAVVATFSAPGNAPVGQSYTATACTSASMTPPCVTQTGYTSGAQLSGLTQGTTYYVTITATASTGYLASTSSAVGPTMATAQLGSPTGVTLGYGSVAGSISVAFTAPSGAPGGQTYTVKVCTTSGMGGTCYTNASFTSGSNFTGLSYSQGSAGTSYYVTVTANASTGYLASTSSVAGPQAATSQIGTPASFSASPSTTTAGAITANFSAPSGTAPSSYSVQVCTNAAMNTGCATTSGYTSGSQLSGLTPGTNYYAQVTAIGPTGYVNATTAVSSATMATVQLTTPTSVSLGYGTVAGSIAVSFTGSSNAPSGETYTATACTTSSMTAPCYTGTIIPGANLTGIPYTAGSAGATYYVTVAANATTGYLASAATSPTGPQHDTSQLNAPTGFSAASSLTTAGAVTATFGAPSGTAPSSYTAQACTSATMSSGCTTVNGYSSGGQISSLTQGTNYYVQVTANPPTGYVASTTAISSATMATVQLAVPTGLTLGYGSVAGSITVSFSGSSNAAAGQTYTVEVCTTSGMGGTCYTNASFTSGSNFTGLSYSQGSAGTNYYVTVTANASTGYLASSATSVAGPQAATSQVNAPTSVTASQVSHSSSTLKVTFTAPTGVAPASYTALACTNSNMATGCISPEAITSGGSITGLSANTTYYVTVTAVGPTGYLSATSTPPSSATTYY